MTKLVLAIAAVLLQGCVGAAAFQARLAQRSGEIMYLHDTAGAERQEGTVSLGAFSVVDDALPLTTTVRRTGGYAVPLLFVNLWQGRYECMLGAEQIDNDYVQFMKESLTEELKRGAKYTFADRGGGMEIDVNVTRIRMSAPITEFGHFMFLLVAAGWGSGVRAGPVDVAIEGEAVVRRHGVEVLRKAVSGKARAGVLPRKGWTIDDFTITMVEGLSLAVKSFNDTVVAELNAL